MRIYSLSGASGTGKSTSALQFAHEHNIPAIIDDGLLIINGEKVAGTSAKFEKNTLKAVRRAIFDDEQHKNDVVQALNNIQPEAILIIGTSDKMTDKIAKRLQLGNIMKYVHVEDVRTEKEIQMARFIREIQGKHVMPVPYRQVEQNFFKRFIQRGKEIFTPNREKIGETTIVRPDFHHQTITIARAVFIDVIKHVVEKNTMVSRLVQLHFTIVSVPQITIEIQITAPVSYYIPDAIELLQQDIANSFQYHFSILPETINVKVLGIETSIK